MDEAAESALALTLDVGLGVTEGVAVGCEAESETETNGDFADDPEVLGAVDEEVTATTLTALLGLVRARNRRSLSSIVMTPETLFSFLLSTGRFLGGMNITGFGIDGSTGFGDAVLIPSTMCFGASRT